MTASAHSASRASGLRVTLMRGGTSKGVFVDDRDLPSPGPARDAVLLKLMGSPDPMQLDGLGGTHSSTSKVIALAPSAEPGVDVEYSFAQVGIETAVVDHVGNCGNLTSAVGPYAIDAGWVEAVEPITTVVLRNLNTGAVVRAHVPVRDGRAAADGEERIAGVPTPGPRIVTEYLDPAGTVFGATYPTGSASEIVEVEGHTVPVSVIDVAHPVAFAGAAGAGFDAGLRPAEANASAAILHRLERLRAACAALLPAAGRPASRNLPRLVLVLPLRPGDAEAGVHLRVVGVSAGRVHHALPVTSALCAAAALTLPKTIPAELAGTIPIADEVRIAHPKGIVVATVEKDENATAHSPAFSTVGIVRTARRLLDGVAYLRAVQPS